MPPPVPAPPSGRLPDGFRAELDRRVRRSASGRLLLGGVPPRLLRLGPRAARMLDGGTLTAGEGTAALLRRLLDAGVLHPRPDPAPARAVTVVVPVRDRAELLDRLLARLRGDPSTEAARLVVVDDGSADPARIAAVAARHGAELVAHRCNRGPAAARNSGLRRANTELVAFCDSDVQPRPGWLAPLLAQFADPAVALAAPRVVAADDGGRGWLARYERVRSPLDMGPDESPVVPMSPVAYVPSAAVVLRRGAAGGGFDESLRVGEDVDLCLRLYAAGWRCRYVPSARVAHHHRTGTGDWLAQRFRYGRSAAALSVRHPGRVAPVWVAPWSVAACTLPLCGPVGVACSAALVAAVAARLARRMPDADAPVRDGARLALGSVRSAATQLAGSATRHHWPLALALCAVSRRARLLVAAAAVADGLLDARRGRASPAASGDQALPVLVHLLVRRADDLAYGAGLWWGALSARTTAPLRPRLGNRRAR